MIVDAVIDIKDIPECQELKIDGEELIYGSALPLNKIRNMRVYPLLEKIISEIADYTSRNKITLGGNICANIIYREAVLPFLLTDAKVVIANRNGSLEDKPIAKVFNEKLQLNDGDLLVQLKVNKESVKLPYFATKIRRQWNVGYPLITIAAVKEENIKMAFSGLISYPFRNPELDKIFNDHTIAFQEKMEIVQKLISSEVLDDIHGSKEYRLFVLQNLITDTFDTLGGKM